MSDHPVYYKVYPLNHGEEEKTLAIKKLQKGPTKNLLRQTLNLEVTSLLLPAAFAV